MLTLVETIVIIVVTIAFFIIAFWVLLANRKDKKNIYFFWFSIVLGIMVSSAYFSAFPVPDNIPLALFISKITYASASLMLLFLYLFSLYFPSSIKRNKYFTKAVVIVNSLITFITLTTGYIANGAKLQQWGFDVVYGPLYFGFFVPYGIVVLCLILINFIRQYKQSSKTKKTQLQYLLIGFGLFVLFEVIFNLILPVTTGHQAFYNLGNGSAIFVAIFTSIAIVRQKLFGIKVVITELFVGLLGILLLVWSLLAQNLWWKLSGFIIFILFCFFGYFLIKSVLNEIKSKDREIKRRREIEKLLDEISHKNIQLNKLLNMRSKFLDTASHQLRTPVSIMKGVMEMVTSGEIDKVSPERRKMLMDGVYLKTKKLENIITDILDATEMDTEKFTLSKSLTQKVQLEELINNIVISHQLDAETKKIELIYHKPKDSLPTILGSQKHLDQVFSNLVDNAIKYTPSKNQAMGEKGRVLISLSKDDNNVIVSVSDNGIGIPGKEIKNLFEKFSRATNAKEMYTDGTGLGLFIAKEIIIGHHGKITVTSEINKGTTFKVYLPVLK